MPLTRIKYRKSDYYVTTVDVPANRTPEAHYGVMTGTELDANAERCEDDGPEYEFVDADLVETDELDTHHCRYIHGWHLFESSRGVEIQCDDEAALFVDDEEAAGHVALCPVCQQRLGQLAMERGTFLRQGGY